MKRFCRTLFVVTLLTVSLASGAWGEVNVNVNVGIPGPQIVLSAPPEFIMPVSLGFYVAVGVPYDLYRISNSYYVFRDNAWYRGRYYNGPWLAMNQGQLPESLRRHQIEKIRTIRDEEYRHYRDNRDGYRGKHFKPDKAWKEQRKDDKKHAKQEKGLMKEERRDNRERPMDDRRGGREEGDRGGHGRGK